MTNTRAIYLTAALVSMVCVSLNATPAADHPTLVSIESADCGVCHEDLFEGRSVLHEPAGDDCTLCHDMSSDEEGTSVALAESEPALCLACHDDLEAAAAGELDSPHYPVTESCSSCHSPHATAAANLLLAPATELCGTCHDLADLDDVHGGQLTAVADCAACHRPHGSQSEHLLKATHQHRPFADGSCNGCHRAPFGERIRLRARGEKLCMACHSDLTPGTGGSGTVHAALSGERGRAGCLNCHDPHMSEQPALLIGSGPDLCRECHSRIAEAASAESGHAAAADDCLTCHRPHASTENALLAEPAGELCGMCHDVEDDELTAVHLGADLAGLDCVSCHTPHGSGHDKLMADVLHEPVVDGCDTCHEGAFDALAEGGDSPLCLMCHDDVGEFVAQAEVPHAALEAGGCVECHNPHASTRASLVKSGDGATCAACHDEQAASEGEQAHGVIAAIGCHACHEPHGGSREKLLRASGDDLCLGCHDGSRIMVPADGADVLLLGRFPFPADRVAEMASLRLSTDGEHGHPLYDHRVSGVPTKEELKRTDATFDGTLTCLTCHDPHKGRSRGILNWNVSSPSEACLNCHPK